MFKVGEIVAPYTNMSMVGRIVKLVQVPVDTWFIGGTASVRFDADVELQDGTGRIVRFRLADLRYVE
jgi:hypothetical protein